MIEILKLDIKKELVRMQVYQPEYHLSKVSQEDMEALLKGQEVGQVVEDWACIKYYDAVGKMRFAMVEKALGREVIYEILGIAEADYKRNLSLKFADGVIRGLEQGKTEQTIELNHKFTQYSFWKRLKLAFKPFNAFEYE